MCLFSIQAAGVLHADFSVSTEHHKKRISTNFLTWVKLVHMFVWFSETAFSKLQKNHKGGRGCVMRHTYMDIFLSAS